MVPVIVLTGFLGSGKTTLLNQILAERARVAGDGPTDDKLAVVVNEFGTIGIDADLLPDEMTRQVELRGGCICCALDEDLEKTLMGLVTGQPNLSAIVIETTGIAEPLPISWTLERSPLCEHVRLAAIVTVVDALEHERHRPMSPTVDTQVEYADILVLSKGDLASSEKIEQVVGLARQLNDVAPLLDTVGGDVARRLMEIVEGPAMESITESGRSRPGPDGDTGSRHEFVAVSVPIEKTLDFEELTESLEELPPDYVRIKGIARVVDATTGSTEPRMVVFHRGGSESFGRAGGSGAAHPSGGDWPKRLRADPGCVCRGSRGTLRGLAISCAAVSEVLSNATTLRELLQEVRKGFALYTPILVRVHDDMSSLDTSTERTLTMSEPLDWAEQYTREYANENYLVVGPNSLRGGLDRRVTLGRSRSCDVRIENESVSKIHAAIIFDRSSGRLSGH